MRQEGITYQWFAFGQLPKNTLYEILTFRQNVFIVEQDCPYMDMDGLDQHAWHLIGCDGEGELVAYLRLVSPGTKYPDPSLGRVLTHRGLRGLGIGRQLMIHGIKKSNELYPGQPIRISAQVRQRGFYEKLRFTAVGDPYDEDGIPHIEMIYLNCIDP